ncbi:hypothetical protein H072_114 [Dactylellina haptotyla CBS 200.50]|uniref:Uncharacterized protein n=1 Tax=Dactylellina haptotyla (strain CBS 200.50) TaxID=1284197 RepID=S8C1U0_DACHA|nr:hypothetical protein H072_114 [Dactylellina haptotyla CBS 200.50]
MFKKVWDYVSGSPSQKQSQDSFPPQSQESAIPINFAKDERKTQEDELYNMNSSPPQAVSRGHSRHRSRSEEHGSPAQQRSPIAKRHKRKPSNRKAPPVEEEIEIPATVEPVEEEEVFVEEDTQVDPVESGDGGGKRKRAVDGDRASKKRRRKQRGDIEADGETVTLNGTLPLGGEVDHVEGEEQEAPEAVEETPKKLKKKSKTRKARQPTPEPEEEEEQQPEEEEQPTVTKSSKKTSANPFSRSIMPKVIIPLSTDGSHTNSKGVAPPPRRDHYEAGAYTSDEDSLIHAVVHKYCMLHIPSLSRDAFIQRIWEASRNKTDFWNILMHNLPHRSRYSLYCHVKRMYNDFPDRGKWTAEQDEELRTLVAAKGTKWNIIGREINRMPEDCRDRWKNYLVCGEKRKRDQWSEEEEGKLTEILGQMLTVLVKHHEENETLVLTAKEGETEEDRVKRLEEEKDYHRDEIDWGIVSDRMGHTRSRMQCSWKGKRMWTKEDDGAKIKQRNKNKGKQKKFLEEEKDQDEVEEATSPAIEAGKNMKPGDYLILTQSYDCLASIDWNKIASMDPVKHFTPEQFKAGFHRYMKDNNPERKDLRLFITQQLEDMQALPAYVRNKRYKPTDIPSSQVASSQAPSQRVSSTPQTSKVAEVTEPASSKPGFRARKSSKHAIDAREVELPTHSPTNPFTSINKPQQAPASPSARKSKKGKGKESVVTEIEPVAQKKAKALKTKSPKKEYLSQDELEHQPEEDEEEDEEDVAVEEIGESGLEADDEMGESVQFGQARRRR